MACLVAVWRTAIFASALSTLGPVIEGLFKLQSLVADQTLDGLMLAFLEVALGLLVLLIVVVDNSLLFIDVVVIQLFLTLLSVERALDLDSFEMLLHSIDILDDLDRVVLAEAWEGVVDTEIRLGKFLEACEAADAETGAAHLLVGEYSLLATEAGDVLLDFLNHFALVAFN